MTAQFIPKQIGTNATAPGASRKSTGMVPARVVGPSKESGNGSNTTTRVWVRQTAVDAVARKGSIPGSYMRNSGSGWNSNRRQSCSNSSSTKDFSDSESTCSTSFSTQQGRPQWGWRAAILTEQSTDAIVVRLDEEDPTGLMSRVPMPTTVRLPSSALTDGDVLFTNDYETDESGNVRAPHDLISLTHLHEPAVLESLQARYRMDQIYTSTGAVLLALNPFQNVRGLYGEGIMKKYCQQAETGMSRSKLPPHVYAIADEAYRALLRTLDDTCTSPRGQQTTRTANQSILVSGESGAGKTVTTKFVMKYLAALSQRSIARQAP